LLEALMVLKRGWLAAIGVAALVWNGLSAAQQYRADELLDLDLSRAVLSPRPLGPAASFARGPLDVTVDRGNYAAQVSAESVVEPKTEKTEPKVEPKTVTTAAVHVESKPTTATSGMRAAHARADRSAAHAPRALVVLHQRDPVEAQARDTRIQVWPCKSGGICNWKR
jgi:hypothetical protein